MILKTQPNGYIVGHLHGKEIIRVAPLPTNDFAKLHNFLYRVALQKVKAVAKKEKGGNVLEFKQPKKYA